MIRKTRIFIILGTIIQGPVCMHCLQSFSSDETISFRMDIHDLITKAQVCKQGGLLEESLELYSQAFNVLVVEAIEYARGWEEFSEDAQGRKQLSEEYYEKTKEYFKQTDSACLISNAMGILFLELGNIHAARDMFHQAIDLTPNDFDFPDPYDALQKLDK